MKGITRILACAVYAAVVCSSSFGQTGDAEIVRYEDELSRARLDPARLDKAPGLAVIFEGTDDLHYYARSETAPAPGLQLTVEAASASLDFGDAVFPPWEMFTDSAGQNVEVYVGDFTVFVPIREASLSAAAGEAQVAVRIAGIACTSMLCLPPFEKSLNTTIDLSGRSDWRQVSPDASQASQPSGPPQEAVHAGTGRQQVLPYSTGVYYLLAVGAGLSINVMPCVLPVLPLILMRLIDQSKHAGGGRIASGLAFCAGVILFFGAFALLSAIVSLTTGAVLDLNSLFRYPSAVIALFLAIVFFGLVMLDVVTLTLPPFIAGGQGAASGVAGSVGMGFFAGILSTPCSGALLGFVLVWAQTQPLLVSSAAIVLMGVGMALPYAAIVLSPSLLDRVPKPGHWMEIFKKTTGFILFLIAAKLTLAALPKERLLNVLMYGIVFSFCVWMWGKWVDFSTPAARRWTIRLIAVVIAVGAAFWLLPAAGKTGEAIADWQSYDRDIVRRAVSAGRPVLLKFTADWCTNCKVVERRVYQDVEVVDLIRDKDVLPIKADTTLIDYPATEDLKQLYGEAGNVPVSIVLLPGSPPRKLRGIFDKEELMQLLNLLPEGRE